MTHPVDLKLGIDWVQGSFLCYSAYHSCFGYLACFEFPEVSCQYVVMLSCQLGFCSLGVFCSMNSLEKDDWQMEQLSLMDPRSRQVLSGTLQAAGASEIL